MQLAVVFIHKKAAQPSHAADRLIENSLTAALGFASFQFLLGALCHPSVADTQSVRQRLKGIMMMYKIRDLFDMIDQQHSYEFCGDPSAIEALELKYGYPLPDDLKIFYQRYKTVSLFDGPFGPTYCFVPVSKIHPTRKDIYGEDTDEWGPSTWITVCDVLDGNYITLDIASGSGDYYNYIDCFHETFAMPGESMIIARSFAELLNSAIQGGGNRLFWGIEGFVSYGDGMPLTAQNAAKRIDNPEAPEKGWSVRFTYEGKTYHEFFKDSQYGGREQSFEAVERHIEAVTK